MRTSQIQVLERLYYLSQIDSRLVPGDRLKAMMTEERVQEWDQKMIAARENAAQSDQVKDLEILFSKDPVKRLDGETRLLGKWKQEYRSMV